MSAQVARLSAHSGESHMRALLLASVGSAFEFYDFVIFAFFSAIIAKLFFPPSLPDWSRQLQSYAIFAAGYIVRPLGGIVMAHFGDTRGRKRVFAFSLLLMAMPTLLIGILPTYLVMGLAAPMLLLVVRLLQGMAIGGEAPGGGSLSPNAQKKEELALPSGCSRAGCAEAFYLVRSFLSPFGRHFRRRKLLRAHGGFHFLSAGFSRSAQPCCAGGFLKPKRFVKCGSARELLVNCLCVLFSENTSEQCWYRSRVPGF
jgi:MFS family permease